MRRVSGAGDGVISSSKSLSCKQLHVLTSEGGFFAGFSAAGAQPESYRACHLRNSALKNNGRTDALRENPALLVQGFMMEATCAFCWMETGHHMSKATVISAHLAGKIYHFDTNRTRTG